jgi:hypothetical protein
MSLPRWRANGINTVLQGGRKIVFSHFLYGDSRFERDVRRKVQKRTQVEKTTK